MLCLVLVACPAAGSLLAAFALDAQHSAPGVFTVAAAVGWNGLLFLGVFAGVRQLRRVSGFSVDAAGLRLWAHGESPWPLPWSEIAGVAIGLHPSFGSWRAPRPSLWALEIYPADPGSPRVELTGYPALVEAPPVAHLPQRRHLIALPMLAGLPNRIEAAVREAQPEAWVGRHEHTAGEPSEEFWPGPA